MNGMIVRSLFVKIFLWFWLAITVVIASLALVTWLYDWWQRIDEWVSQNRPVPENVRPAA